MPQVNTEKHTRISKTKVKKFETAESLFPTVSFQVGSSPAPLTVNRGRGQREGRVPSWQKNCFLQLPPRFFPARFQCFSRYRLLLLAPFLRRRGSFCSGTLLFRPSFSNFPFLFLFWKTKKANESFSFAALFGREKISHSPVCDSIFSCLLGQIFSDMSSRPTKILKISVFRDFFVTGPTCQKGAKTRVKPVFFR